MSRKPTPVNIRNFSVKCGRCGGYPALSHYEPSEEHNLYRFECDDPGEGGEACPPILLEIPIDLDEFGNRDPNWGGGKKHAGPDARAEEAAEETASDIFAEDSEAPETSEASTSGGLLPVVSD